MLILASGAVSGGIRVNKAMMEGSAGHRMSCPGPSPAARTLLTDSEMTSPGGITLPLFGNVEISHTKAAQRSYLQI